MDATGILARWRPWLSEKELDVVHRSSIKHQVADRLSQLTKTVEDCSQVDDALSVISVSSLTNNERKGRIKLNNIIDDCDNTGATATSGRLHAVCPITTLRAETKTPTLMELVTAKDKVALCRQMAGTVRAPGSCYS